jgi:hypothetical protein
MGSGKCNHSRTTTRNFIDELPCLDVCEAFRFHKISEVAGFLYDGEFLQITGTPTGFGIRRWFTCPYCGRNARRLYLSRGKVACRLCHRLVYRSQNKTLADRLLGKRQTIWKRLGGHHGFGDFIRPKGMHHRTFWNLVQKDRELEILAYRAYIASAENFADLDPFSSVS